MAITAYPNFNLFKGRNTQAVQQQREVMEKFRRYQQRNADFGLENTDTENTGLIDKENLPI